MVIIYLDTFLETIYEYAVQQIQRYLLTFLPVNSNKFPDSINNFFTFLLGEFQITSQGCLPLCTFDIARFFRTILEFYFFPSSS